MALKTYRQNSRGTVLPGGVLGRYSQGEGGGVPAIWRSDTGQGNTPQGPTPFPDGGPLFVGRFGPGLDLYKDPASGGMYFYNVQQDAIYDGQGQLIASGGRGVPPANAAPVQTPAPVQAPAPRQAAPPFQEAPPVQTPPPVQGPRGSIPTPQEQQAWAGDPASQYGLPSPWGTVGGPTSFQHPRANAPATAQDIIDAWQIYTGEIPSGSNDITGYIGKPLTQVVKDIASKGPRGSIPTPQEQQQMGQTLPPAQAPAPTQARPLAPGEQPQKFNLGTPTWSGPPIGTPIDWPGVTPDMQGARFAGTDANGNPKATFPDGSTRIIAPEVFEGTQWAIPPTTPAPPAPVAPELSAPAATPAPWTPPPPTTAPDIMTPIPNATPEMASPITANPIPSPDITPPTTLPLFVPGSTAPSAPDLQAVPIAPTPGAVEPNDVAPTDLTPPPTTVRDPATMI